MSDNKIIKAIQDKGKTMESEMSFFEHLEALRWHLIRAGASVLVFAIIAFCNFHFIFYDIIQGPFKPSFWTYRMMCKLGSSFCVTTMNANLINTEVAGQFMLQINQSILIGIIVS